MIRKVRNYINSLKDEYLYVSSLLKSIREYNRLLEEYNPNTHLSQVKYDDLCQLLYNCELMSLRIRKTLSEYDFGEQLLFTEEKQAEVIPLERWKTVENYFPGNNYEGLGFEDYPVKIDYCDGLLTVHTPLTFKRGYKKGYFMTNYLLASYLEGEIRRWMEANSDTLLGKIDAPTYIIMKRKTVQFNLNKTCDNDNLENQRIINTITRALGIEDNARNITLVSSFQEVNRGSEEGMTFYVFSRKDIDKYWYLL
ncbi:MAG: hypothetical protein IJ115_07165 [Erysipelotrichaceae bacterium]|nr:hypothetical protein [Erysipelotrichaceae bacterium]